MKKQNGITLIALVITIIVLLILAGITITAILGDNGILGKSEKAKLKTEQAAILEELRLKAYDKKTEDINNEMLNIDYLKDAGYIKEEFTQAENTCYAINPNRLNPVPVTGKGTVDDGDIYYLLNGTLYYKQTNDEDTEIGPVFKENYAMPDPVSDVEWFYEETPEGEIEITGFDIDPDNTGYIYDVTVNCPVLYIPSKIKGKRVVRVSFDNYHKKSVVSGINKIIYPDTVKEIGGSAMIFPDIMEISLPNNLIKICDSAFCYPSIEKIELPETVRIIENSALRSCLKLKQINLPRELETLGSDVFSYCYSLESITIPKNITEIPNYSFSGCYSLKNVTFLGNVTSIGNSAFSGCSSLADVTLPASLKEIGAAAFSGCGSLINIIIPDSVTSIGGSAFSNCSSLANITVDENNPKYDSRNNCNAIVETENKILIVGCKNTIIPDTVTSIGEYAFAGSSSLTNIIIPASVTTIGSCTFNHCKSLTDIYIKKPEGSISGSPWYNSWWDTKATVTWNYTE